MHQALFITLAATMLLPGCASTPRDSVAERRGAYQHLLRYIKPDMTRRQLYALLPPSRTPLATPPRIFSIAGIADYTPQTELHPLDTDFSLLVLYRPADIRAYPSRISYSRSTPNLIDELLFYTPPTPLQHPSHQNLDDQLVASPMLRGPGVPQTKTVFFTSIYPRLK